MHKKMLLLLVCTICCISVSGALADPPINDDCTNATVVGDGILSPGEEMTFTGDNIDATNDCEDVGIPEVWIKFTIEECMDIIIDYCGTDPVVGGFSRYLYDSCPCGGTSYTEEDIYFCDDGNAGYYWIDIPAGTYWYPVIVDEGNARPYNINVSGEACPGPPANDNCANAISIGEVTDLEFTTRNGNFDGEGTCLYNSSPNVWYVYTPSFTGYAEINPDPGDEGCTIAIYDGYTCSPLPEELLCSSESENTIPVIQGQQYLIEIGGGYDNYTSGILTISEGSAPIANDDCANATVVGDGILRLDETMTFTGNSSGATNDCEWLGYPEVWITFTLEERLNVTIDYCGSNPIKYNPSSNLYDDCPCGEIIYYTSDSTCSDDNMSYFFEGLEAGTYWFAIIYDEWDIGPYVVNASATYSPPPTGACCWNDGQDCDVMVEYDCIELHDGSWRGAGSTCGEYNEEDGWSGCQDQTGGACCYDDGLNCVIVDDEFTCLELYNGNWKGEGSDCGEYIWEQGWSNCLEEPGGACCYNNGFDCIIADDEFTCVMMYGGTWKGQGSDCGEFDEETGWTSCQEQVGGACCYNNGFDCIIADNEYTCIVTYDGTWKGQGSDCGEFDEETGWTSCQGQAGGACCLNDGFDCVIVNDEFTCLELYGGIWKGEGSDCGEFNEETGWTSCNETEQYQYLPGDANMSAGLWPPSVVGGDVTYLVNYFRGITAPCMLDGFYASADANGSCSVTGADVTKLVSYFRGMDDLNYCPDYPTTWPPIPDTAPDGWPNCASPVLSK